MASLTAKTEKYQPLINEKVVNSAAGAPQQYDRYRVPPNFQHAEEHLTATRVAKPLEKPNLRIDAASQLPIENKGLSICCDIYDLNFLSPGYPMYFQFIKFCLIIGVAIFLSSGVHNIYVNREGSACMNSTAYYADYIDSNDTNDTPNFFPFFTNFQATTTTTSPNGTTTTSNSNGTTTTTNPNGATTTSNSNGATTTTNPNGTTTTSTSNGGTTTTNPSGSTTTTTTQPSNTATQPNNNKATPVSDSNAKPATTTTNNNANSGTTNSNQDAKIVQAQPSSGYDDTSTDASDISYTSPDADDEECPENRINVLSLANITNDTVELEKEDIYNFFTIVILLLIMQFVRKIQKQTAVICDERELTASDYTIRVTNLPKDFDQSVDIDEVIKAFFVENGLPGKPPARPPLNVQKVSVCYDSSERYVVEKKLEKTIEDRSKLKARKNTKNELISDDEIATMKTEIQTYKDQLTAISKKFQEGVGVSKQFEGEAYVTFETQQEAKLVLRYWNLSGFTRFRLWFTKNSPYHFRNKVPVVREAPEPSDIVWENAGTSSAAKHTIRAITSVIIIGILFAAFVAIFEIQQYKTSILQDLKTSKADIKTKGVAASFQIKIISIGSSLFIVTINMLLRAVLQFLTQKGMYSTHTEFLTVYAKRLATAQFINTAIVSFVVSVIFNNITGEGGLIYTATFIVLTDIAVQCGLAMFNIGYFSYLFKKVRTSKQKDPIITQQQLNQTYKLPAFDFATKYAGYAKIMLTTSFFAPLIPVVVPAAIGGIFVLYWLDKYNLLRRSSRGKAAGTELPFEFIEFLEYCLVLFAIGNFLVNVYVVKFDASEETLTLVGFAIGILNAILPMEEINEWLFPGKDEALTNDRYSAIKHTFVEDYDRMNPATADIANAAFTRERALRNNQA